LTKKVTTTARSKRFLEAKGFKVALVERTARIPDRRPSAKPGAQIFQKWDAFSFADLIAVHPALRGTLYVQTTSRDNQAARRQKVLEQEATLVIMKAGNMIEVHGWAKVGGRGQRKLWQVSRFVLALEHPDTLVWTEYTAHVDEDGIEEKQLFEASA
jgi:hypothetical protein